MDRSLLPSASASYATVFSHRSVTGIDVIIQDHFGLVITVFAWYIGVIDVIFETNSATVCYAMESPTDAPVSISTIVSGLCSKLREFRTFQASHVGHQGNKPAHILAAFAKNIDSFVTWMEECPPFLTSAVSLDAMLFYAS